MRNGVRTASTSTIFGRFVCARVFFDLPAVAGAAALVAYAHWLTTPTNVRDVNFDNMVAVM